MSKEESISFEERSLLRLVEIFESEEQKEDIPFLVYCALKIYMLTDQSPKGTLDLGRAVGYCIIKEMQKHRATNKHDQYKRFLYVLTEDEMLECPAIPIPQVIKEALEEFLIECQKRQMRFGDVELAERLLKKMKANLFDNLDKSEGNNNQLSIL